jgi:hypothetical protein
MIITILVTVMSDRHGERTKHIIFPAIISAFGFTAVVLATFVQSNGGNVVLAYLGTVVATAGIWPTLGPCCAWLIEHVQNSDAIEEGLWLRCDEELLAIPRDGGKLSVPAYIRKTAYHLPTLLALTTSASTGLAGAAVPFIFMASRSLASLLGWQTWGQHHTTTFGLIESEQPVLVDMFPLINASQQTVLAQTNENHGNYTLALALLVLDLILAMVVAWSLQRHISRSEQTRKRRIRKAILLAQKVTPELLVKQ